MAPRKIDLVFASTAVNLPSTPGVITYIDPKHADATPGHDGSSRDEALYGTAGRDIMYGDAGDDFLWGGDGHDIMFGGNGNDTLYGGNGDDYINGGRGNDYTIAGDGRDTIEGGGGRDWVSAGAGNDTIQFAAPNQTGNFHGNAGADLFWVGENFSGGIVIGDFKSAEGDRLVFDKGVVNWNEEYYQGSWGMTHWFEDGSWAFVAGQTNDSLYVDMANGAIISM